MEDIVVKYFGLLVALSGLAAMSGAIVAGYGFWTIFAALHVGVFVGVVTGVVLGVLWPTEDED